MRKNLNVDQARFIALLARSARTQCDALLGHVAERTLGGRIPGRGEHNPTAQLGLEPLPTDDLRRWHFVKQLLRYRGRRVRSFMR